MNSELFQDQVLETIRRRDLISAGDTVVCGLSGGADSVALLRVLLDRAAELGIRVRAAHLDHALRPDSGSDAAFARAIADRWGVPLALERVSWGKHGPPAANVEAAAREQRYAFLHRVAAAEDASGDGRVRIAVGHHATDRLETFLAQLIRGAGPRGLSLPRAAREDGVIRPLFDRTAEEIREFLRLREIDWREDPTNADGSNLRARLRRDVIPLLRRENPEIERVVGRSGDLLAGLSDHLERAGADALQELVVHEGARELTLAGPQSRAYDAIILSTALRLAIRRLGGNPSDFGFGVMDRCARDWREGAVFALEPGAGFRISGDGRGLHVTAATPDVPAPGLAERTLPVPGRLSLGPSGGQLTADRLDGAAGPAWLRAARSEGPRVAWLDAASVRGGLQVRGRRPGDRYRPLGLDGSIKVQDLMVNKKVPRRLRESVPIVADDTGIVWIPGFRVDTRTRITEETDRALRLELTGPAPWCEEIRPT